MDYELVKPGRTEPGDILYFYNGFDFKKVKVMRVLSPPLGKRVNLVEVNAFPGRLLSEVVFWRKKLPKRGKNERY